jgi:hypothetical protein
VAASVTTALAGCGAARSAAPGSGDTARDPAPAPAGAPRQPAGRATDGRFVPRVRRDGYRVVLPVNFTDGTRAELVYPARLGIAELGVVPYGSATLHGESPAPGRSDFVGRDFLIRYGDASGAPGMHYLRFRFGRWHVLVYDYPRDNAASMTEEERAAWARNFSGHEDADGYLRLSGSGPLRLARAGDHAGPELEFGSPGGRWVALYPGRCRLAIQPRRRVRGKLASWPSPHYATWCASPSMRVDTRGERGFIAALIGDLAVRDVRLARG